MGQGVTALRYSQGGGFSEVQVGIGLSKEQLEGEEWLDALLKVEQVERYCWGRGDTECQVFGFGIRMFKPKHLQNLWDALFVVDFGEAQELVFTDCKADTMSFLMKGAVRAVLLPDEIEVHLSEKG